MSGLRARRVARTSTVSGVGVLLLLAGIVSGPQLSHSAATADAPVLLVAQPLTAPPPLAVRPAATRTAATPAAPDPTVGPRRQ